MTPLETTWFILICILWVGYFVLEGFDFGVGMLVKRLARDDTERRMLIHTIGPVWDGNEVWLLVAGGATFAAFPGWYASTFSGFYVALFLVLAALIVRGVAFEFWGKDERRGWRSTWEWALAGGSFLAALLWGVAWADIVHGVPMNAKHDMTASLWDLLHPYALLGGLTTLALFLAHGAVFLTLRTKGEMVDRARGVARVAAPVAAALTTAFLTWTVVAQSNRGGIEVVSALLAAGAVGLAWAAPVLIRRRPGWAFGASAAAIALLFAALFADLFPNALRSTTNHAFTLTLHAAASTKYTLTVMTVVAVLLVPVVLAYQAWSYWVFRHRLGREDFEDVRSPIDLLARTRVGAEPAEPAEPAPRA
jgi:cytochrome d ubiquinol oxidase subunit II